MNCSSVEGRRCSDGDEKAAACPEQYSLPHAPANNTDREGHQFRAFFYRLGVRSDAWDGWATIHDNPHRLFLANFLVWFIALTRASFLTITSRPIRWGHHLPCAILLIGHLIWIVILWRWGPIAAKTRACYATGFVTIGMQLVISISLMLGPTEWSPFGSRLTFICLDALAIWLGSLCGQFGSWAPDHPAQPHRTFAEPLVTATIRALRVTDAITDMYVIKVMLQRAEAPCFWFGQQRACLRWRVMAAFAGAFAVMDLCTSMYISMGLTVTASGQPPAKLRTRARRSAHIVSFTCEVGVMFVTLVTLFSDFEEPAASITAAERQSSISLTVASFLVTLASFALTMLGMRRVLHALNRVTVEVRARISSASPIKIQPDSRQSGNTAPPCAASSPRQCEPTARLYSTTSAAQPGSSADAHALPHCV